MFGVPMLTLPAWQFRIGTNATHPVTKLPFLSTSFATLKIRATVSAAASPIKPHLQLHCLVEFAINPFKYLALSDGDRLSA
jgi:hypothetical protein